MQVSATAATAALAAFRWPRWTNDPSVSPQTYRKTPDETAKRQQYVRYARAVGGTTLHFTGNFWRLRPIDFHEASKRGTVPGSTLTDWPGRM